MRIEKIHIDSFMGSYECDIELSRGVNILRGDNESGKSTVAEFIKFMLYGASARGLDGAIPERQKYLSFGEGSFGGYMELAVNSGRFRIDRTVTQTQSGFRESLAITDLDKKVQVYKGENPGDVLCGVPENVFTKIAYISQDGEAYTGGAELGSAIENLLFSADETVSTDKALKKLDALRVSLLHKNGKGGQLFELAKDREELSVRLEKALSDNSDIIAKEGSLIETERRIEENKTEYQRAKKLCELYDNYVAHTRFKKLDETKADVEQTAAAITAVEEAFDGFIPDGEYLGRLRQTAEQVQTLSISTQTARKKYENAIVARKSAEEAVIVDNESASLKAAAERMSKDRGVSKLFSSVGIGLLILAVAFVGITFLMKLGSALYIAAAVVAVIGIAMFALGTLKKNALGAMLAKYDAAGEYELVEKAKELEETAAHSREILTNAREKESAAKALLDNEEKRLADMRNALSLEAKRVGRDGDDKALFDAIEDYIATRSELATKAKLLGGRAAQLERETAAYDRAEVEKLLSAIGDLSVFEKLDITEYSRKRDFCENAIAALEVKKGDLEKSLAALRATVENPALIKATLDELCKKENAAKEKYAAAELAMRSIENASAGLRTRISPHLAEYAGKLMSVMTDGKYNEFGVDGTISLTYLAKGGAHDAAYLSKGTRESAYFALRLALADLLCKEEKLPLILDECFAHVDDVRTKQMLRILMALAAEGTQSLVTSTYHKGISTFYYFF